MPVQSRYCTGMEQKQVGRYSLDGFRTLPNGSRECYEFYSCYYHSCPKCFLDHSKVVHCKYSEHGYVSIERAHLNMIEWEREIRCMLMFDKGLDKWCMIWEHE